MAELTLAPGGWPTCRWSWPTFWAFSGVQLQAAPENLTRFVLLLIFYPCVHFSLTFLFFRSIFSSPCFPYMHPCLIYFRLANALTPLPLSQIDGTVRPR
jgi:hypothetical protein